MKWSKYFHQPAFIAVTFSIIFFILTAPVEFPKLKVKGDTVFELTPPFFKLTTAGYWPAAVELLWIRTLQGAEGNEDTASVKTEFSQFYRLVQALDPYFYETYEQGAIFFSFISEDPDRALEVLDRGIQVYDSGLAPKKFWTHPYSLFIFRAYVNGFLKNDFKSAKSDFLKAAEIPNSPSYLTSMKSWLKEEGSEKALAIRVLKRLAESTSDPQIKKKYLEKLNIYER